MDLLLFFVILPICTAVILSDSEDCKNEKL